MSTFDLKFEVEEVIVSEQELLRPKSKLNIKLKVDSDSYLENERERSDNPNLSIFIRRNSLLKSKSQLMSR